MGQCPNMGKAPMKKKECFVLRPHEINHPASTTEAEKAAIENLYIAGELKACCAMLWDLDALLLEYLGPTPKGCSRPLGSMAYTLVDIRHLILKEMKDIIAEIEGIRD